jgi:hypothetical protein
VAGSASPTWSRRITLTPPDRAAAGSYTGCIAGALSQTEYLAGLSGRVHRCVGDLHRRGGPRHALGHHPRRQARPVIAMPEASEQTSQVKVLNVNWPLGQTALTASSRS